MKLSNFNLLDLPYVDLKQLELLPILSLFDKITYSATTEDYCAFVSSVEQEMISSIKINL